MSAKAIQEATGKNLLNKFLNHSGYVHSKFVAVDESSNFEQLVAENPWLKEERLVVKPDQLIKRRGKLGLIKVNTDINGVRTWVNERIGKDVQVIFFHPI